MSIKDERTDQMIRQYARLHRTTFTGAVRRAVGEALEREGHVIERAQTSEEFMAGIKAIQDRIAAAPILDPRPIDEILYDEDGLPK